MLDAVLLYYFAWPILLNWYAGLYRNGPKFVPDRIGLYEHCIKNTSKDVKEGLRRAYKEITIQVYRLTGTTRPLCIPFILHVSPVYLKGISHAGGEACRVVLYLTLLSW